MADNPKDQQRVKVYDNPEGMPKRASSSGLTTALIIAVVIILVVVLLSYLF